MRRGETIGNTPIRRWRAADVWISRLMAPRNTLKKLVSLEQCGKNDRAVPVESPVDPTPCEQTLGFVLAFAGALHDIGAGPSGQ